MGIIYTISVRTVLCKECPLTDIAYVIIAFNYGERFGHVLKHLFLKTGTYT